MNLLGIIILGLFIYAVYFLMRKPKIKEAENIIPAEKKYNKLLYGLLIIAGLILLTYLLPKGTSNDSYPNHIVILKDQDADGLFFEIYLSDFKVELGKKIAEYYVDQYKNQNNLRSIVFDFWDREFSKENMQSYLDENIFKKGAWEPPKGTRTFMINYWPFAASTPKWKIGEISVY